MSLRRLPVPRNIWKADLMENDIKSLVSTDWLAEHIKDPDLRILDASWYLPDAGRDPRAEFDAAHIKSARFFDIDEVADLRSALPHTVPPVEKFMSRMRAIGVGDGHQVVVYDGAGLFSAARVWWTFRLMGFENVAVLDGGLPKWQAEGRPVDAKPATIRDRHMIVKRQDHLIKDVTQVARAAKLKDHTIIDARPAPRFEGTAPEPREGMRAGHIPNSQNVPFSTLLNDDKTMKTKAELQAVFDAAGADLAKPIITTCGSGVTACVLALALYQIGKTDAAVYDGSWSEWGMYSDLPIATGPADA
jgi:thiosulfate/3-mercaptopyruvate sulfurtransferase